MFMLSIFISKKEESEGNAQSEKISPRKRKKQKDKGVKRKASESE